MAMPKNGTRVFVKTTDADKMCSVVQATTDGSLKHVGRSDGVSLQDQWHAMKICFVLQSLLTKQATER